MIGIVGTPQVAMLASASETDVNGVRLYDDAIEQLLDQAGVIRKLRMAVSSGSLAKGFEYDVFDVGRRHSGHCTGVNASSLLQRVGHIVPISCAALVGMRRRHAVSPIVENAPGQNCG